MRKSNFLAAVTLLPFLAFAQTKTNTHFKLRIKIDSADANTSVFLAYQFDGRKFLDSAKQKDGFFVLSGNVERPLNATLVTDYKGIGSQELIKKSNQGMLDAIKFYIHPGVIFITTKKLIRNAVFSGSVINTDNERMKTLLKDIEDQMIVIDRQLKSRDYRSVSDSGLSYGQPLSAADSQQLRSRLIRQSDSLAGATRPIIKKFILENPHSYIALTMLISYAGSFPNLSVIKPMYDRLSSSLKNSPAGREFHKTLEDVKNLVPGAKAPEFSQNDLLRKPVGLSSFKGKFVLLEFWASWCAPCRAENPELVRVFNEFKKRNFTILGISLDKEDGRDDWEKAIKDDHLDWTQVSDLKHWDNEVAKLYSIHAIPQNFLIGPDGVIVAKGLTPQALRKKLEEILSK